MNGNHTPNSLDVSRPALAQVPAVSIQSDHPRLIRDVRGPLVLGIAAIFFFFLVGGIWAGTAKLTGAAIAPGTVSPESSRQTVQHLEGGIIQELRIHEGQQVQSGDVLLVLEEVRAQAEVGARRSRLRVLAATEARLRAERNDRDSIDFSHPILADHEDSDVAGAIQAQRNQFETRKENSANRRAILAQRKSQLESQINGFALQLKGVKKQHALINEEIVGIKDLFKKGYERKPRLLELQRKQAQLLGTEGELEARIARTQEAIGETQLQIMNLRTQRFEEIDAQLSEVLAQRIELEEQLRTSLDRLRRSEILAPVSGTVINLHFKTTGGVIGPGEPILDLVPIDGDLVIEARVRPADIDEVHAGQSAHVIFPSFTQRNLKRFQGTVQRVSPDTLEDKRTGERYYAAKVTVNRDSLSDIAFDIKLWPGMPAEVFIATQERTLLTYLLQPFLQTLERTFRET